jgi:hypothetical protein
MLPKFKTADEFQVSFREVRLHPPMNTGEMLEIYESETKHSKQCRASSTWEMSPVTPPTITMHKRENYDKQ